MKWEYLVEYPEQDGSLKETLNVWGQGGWELVSIKRVRTNKTWSPDVYQNRYVFKRPLEEQDETGDIES